jgi:hypothetical protein
LYAFVLTNIQNSIQFTSVGCDWERLGSSFPSTYNDGTHGTLTAICVLQVSSTAYNTTFHNPNFAGMYLLDYGVNTRVNGEYIGSAAYDIHQGNIYELGNVGSMGSIFGFTNLANYLDYGTTTTYSITASTGSALFLKETIQPTTNNATTFMVNTQAALNLFNIATTSGGIISVNNGAALNGYSDTGTTQGWSLTVPGSGNGRLDLAAAGSNTISLIGANGTIQAQSLYNTPVGNLSASTGAFTTVTASTSALCTGAGGIGYATGAGGTVTQITSRTTGVTINKTTGAITLLSAAGSATAATFTVTNSSVAANDTVTINQKSGTNLYITAVTAVSAGSFNVTFYTTGGTATDSPVFQFNVIKGAVS